MKTRIKMRLAAAGVLSLSLVGGATVVASAATQSNGSDGALYVYNGNAQLLTDSTKMFLWSENVYGSGDALTYDAPIQCPVTADDAYVFVATTGNERTKAGWSAYGDNAFAVGTTTVKAPNVSPGRALTAGNFGTVKSTGGTYSLGIACTNNNGNTVVGAFYRTISMTAGTGSYTIAPVQDVAPIATPTPVDTETTASIPLSATTVNATEGVLSLSVPVGTAASFGTPTLVNNKSTTTGTLGNVTVSDGRVRSRGGWDLSASVVDFVNSVDTANKISKSQLGLVPRIVSTEATGVLAGTAQVAGAAIYSSIFASGAAANTVGNTVLNADLTFVAPPEKAAGTYTSTLTLTVVSK